VRYPGQQSECGAGEESLGGCFTHDCVSPLVSSWLRLNEAPAWEQVQQCAGLRT